MKKLKNFHLTQQVCNLIDEWSKKTGISKSNIAENGIQKEVEEIKKRFPELN